MLGIGCPDRHALPRITSSKMRRPRRVLPSRASGFVLRRIRDSHQITILRYAVIPVARMLWLPSLVAMPAAGARRRIIA